MLLRLRASGREAEVSTRRFERRQSAPTERAGHRRLARRTLLLRSAARRERQPTPAHPSASHSSGADVSPIVPLLSHRESEGLLHTDQDPNVQSTSRRLPRHLWVFTVNRPTPLLDDHPESDISMNDSGARGVGLISPITTPRLMEKEFIKPDAGRTLGSNAYLCYLPAKQSSREPYQFSFDLVAAWRENKVELIITPAHILARDPDPMSGWRRADNAIPGWPCADVSLTAVAPPHPTTSLVLSRRLRRCPWGIRSCHSSRATGPRPVESGTWFWIPKSVTSPVVASIINVEAAGSAVLRPSSREENAAAAVAHGARSVGRSPAVRTGIGFALGGVRGAPRRSRGSASMRHRNVGRHPRRGSPGSCFVGTRGRSGKRRRWAQAGCRGSSAPALSAPLPLDARAETFGRPRPARRRSFTSRS